MPLSSKKKTEFSEINIKCLFIKRTIVDILIKIDKIITWCFQRLNKLNHLVSSLYGNFNYPAQKKYELESKKN